MLAKIIVIGFALLGILAFFTKFPVKAISKVAFVVPQTQIAVSYGLVGIFVIAVLMLAYVKVGSK
jgi:hypothetical protein